jgi:hypothetical protein
MLDAAKVKLQAMAAKYDAPEAKAKAAEISAQLDQEKAKALQAFGQRAYERSVQAATLGLEAEKVGQARAAAGGALNERLVPGLGYALDKDAAKTLREKQTTYKSLADKVDRLISLRDNQQDNALWTPTKINQARALAAQIKIAINKNEGLSRLSEADLRVLDEIQGGNPARIGYVVPVLEELKKSANQDFMDTAKTYLDPSLSGGGGGAIPMRPLK